MRRYNCNELSERVGARSLISWIGGSRRSPSASNYSRATYDTNIFFLKDHAPEVDLVSPSVYNSNKSGRYPGGKRGSVSVYPESGDSKNYDRTYIGNIFA